MLEREPIYVFVVPALADFLLLYFLLSGRILMLGSHLKQLFFIIIYI